MLMGEVDNESNLVLLGSVNVCVRSDVVCLVCYDIVDECVDTG